MHGYHLGADDSAIYIPAIKFVADPRLYPFGSEFFASHARMSLFPDLIGQSARLTHLPIDWVLFGWHVGSVFLLLTACWELGCICFERAAARWGGVALAAGALSAPVAGTALAVMDPYLTARSLSTPFTIFAIAAFAGGRYLAAGLWLALTALVHPQTSVYGLMLLGCLWLVRENGRWVSPAEPAAFLGGLPFPIDLSPARGVAKEVLHSRTYFFVNNWEWYEWIGAAAPVLFAVWFAWRGAEGTTAAFRRILRAIVPFGILSTFAALVLTYSPSLENFTRLQPMRAFHPIYVVFFVLLGGLMGERVLRGGAWRWAAVFAPLALGMYLLQRTQYPNGPNVEIPGISYHNRWNSAFQWIRGNTPKDAVFALDPGYMLLTGEDQHGFRAVAERSALADAVKDSGAVSLFPGLADEWKRQVNAQTGFARFGTRDFQRLAGVYPATWIVTESRVPDGIVCPYRSENISVCRIGSNSSTP